MIDNRFAPYAATLLRVSMGIMFLAHAHLKIFTFTVAGTVGYFESLGLPGFVAYLTIGAELFGGIALILGVQARYVAAALIPVLLGALWAHVGNGWVFSAPNGGWEFPAFWAAALAVQVLVGDGALALWRSKALTRACPARATSTLN